MEVEVLQVGEGLRLGLGLNLGGFYMKTACPNRITCSMHYEFLSTGVSGLHYKDCIITAEEIFGKQATGWEDLLF